MRKQNSSAPHEVHAVDAATVAGGESTSPGALSRKGTARPRSDSDIVPNRKNITLQLDDDGAPRWASMSEKNRESWRAILTHQKTVESLGLAPVAAADSPGLPAASLLPRPAVDALLDATGRMEALILGKVFHVPFEKSSEVCAFTEKEKDQVAPLLQLLADKWIPAVMEKYGAEFSLGVLFFSMTAARVERLKSLAPKNSSLEDGEPVKPNGGVHPAEARTQ